LNPKRKGSWAETGELSDAGYYYAAWDRFENAKVLYEQKAYVFSIYVFGLAVESLLCAYAVNESSDYLIDHTHILHSHRFEELLRYSAISDPEDEEYRYTLRNEFNFLIRLWENKYRYFDIEAMRSEIKKKKIYKETWYKTAQRGRGEDRGVKAVANRILKAAEKVFERGENISEWKL
jgi:hypothetical protein